MDFCNCKICGNKIEKLFSLGIQPMANKYPANTESFSKEIVADMDIYFCSECLYANLPCSIDRSLFFEDYYYLSSVNKELKNHFNEFAEKLIADKHKFIVDVGSNDGVLLEPLKKGGIRCLGIDPSENVSKLANEKGLDTLVGFFDMSIAKKIKSKYGSPDLICASSVFTHLDNPAEFFRVADYLLDENGSIIIEVEYLKEIIESFGFERFYFDRPHYYSLESLKRLASSYNFHLLDAESIEPHGGSIRVTFSKVSSSENIQKISKILSDEAFALRRDSIVQQFSEFENYCSLLKQSIKEFELKGLSVAGYGCPARFSTITNFADIDTSIIPFVIDDSPLKEDKFSPGKHIPIKKFADSPLADVYVVFAYEYINSIRKKFTKNDIIFYQPIPFTQL